MPICKRLPSRENARMTSAAGSTAADPIDDEGVKEPGYHPFVGTLGARQSATAAQAIPAAAPDAAPSPDAVFISEDEFTREFLKEQHAAPVTILVGVVTLSLGVQAITAFSEAGVGAAAQATIGYLAGTILLLFIGVLGVLGVGRMFAIDLGPRGLVALRVASIYCAADVVLVLGSMVMPPIVCWMLAVLATLILIKVAFGFDLLQMVVVAVLTWAIKVLVMSLLLGPLLAALR
jgi:mannitol-specific phosphotransferase system IIBC component